jgi:hypothetical protein
MAVLDKNGTTRVHPPLARRAAEALPKRHYFGKLIGAKAKTFLAQVLLKL